MKFGPVPVGQAIGAILAHSVPLKAGRMRKGRVLDAKDIVALKDAGFDQVTVARLEQGDVGEDAAALQLARALVGTSPDITLSTPTTGRVNLYARAKGVVTLNPEAISALNNVDPLITCATLANFAPIKGSDRPQMIATVKIISYGVEEGALSKACDLASGAIKITPVAIKGSTLLISTIGGDKRAPTPKAVIDRMHAFGVECSIDHVAHDPEAIAQKLRQDQSDLVMLLGATATSDPNDIGPSAVRLAGGSVTRFGLPVDPGNLLFLGELNEKPIIGLPGCARSPAPNGADWVIERVICNLAPTSQDLAAMGAGGLLKETKQRGRPRED